MRWDALFDDFEALLAAWEARAHEAEVAELVRAERARIELSQRLLAHAGRQITVRVCSGEIDGVLAEVAPAWIVVEDPMAAHLIPVAAILWVEGLGRQSAPPPGAVLRRLGLGHALRALARDRSAVTVQLRVTGLHDAGLPGTGLHSAGLHGTIDRVGADHFDLAVHEPGQWRRTAAVRSVATVAFSGLDWIRSPLR